MQNTVCKSPQQLLQQRHWKCIKPAEICEFPEICSSCKINVSTSSGFSQNGLKRKYSFCNKYYLKNFIYFIICLIHLFQVYENGAIISQEHCMEQNKMNKH